MTAPSDNRTAAMLELVAGMSIVDLSHQLEPGIPVFPTHPQYFSMKWETHDPAWMNVMLVGEHAGTHVDSPSHFYATPGDERNVAAADTCLRSWIGRAVKVELRGRDAAQLVCAADLRDWERSNRQLERDDAVVFDFGWAERWGTFDSGAAYLEPWPGLSRDGAEHLVERGVRAVGTDCLGIDGTASEELGAHFALLGNGIVIAENLCNLDQVPQEFLLIAFPLKIAGGTGSPTRAVALFAGPADA